MKMQRFSQFVMLRPTHEKMRKTQTVNCDSTQTVFAFFSSLAVLLSTLTPSCSLQRCFGSTPSDSHCKQSRVPDNKSKNTRFKHSLCFVAHSMCLHSISTVLVGSSVSHNSLLPMQSTPQDSRSKNLFQALLALRQLRHVP